MSLKQKRSSVSRRIVQAGKFFRLLLRKRLFRTLLNDAVRPVRDARSGWLQSLINAVGKASAGNAQSGGASKVSARVRPKGVAFRNRPVMSEQLELRALMAADLGLDPVSYQQPVAAEVGAMVPGVNRSEVPVSTKEILFVDPGVSDPQSLKNGLRNDVEFVMLNSSQDGVRQIATYLEGRSNIQAIHLVGHGRAGEISLGSSILDNQTLARYTSEFAKIGGSMTANGDILLYSCETAQGAQGQLLLRQISQMTGADVAGSSDITGAANLGGDWALEESIGSVESALFASNESLAQYKGALGAVTLSNTTFPTTGSSTLVSIPAGAISVSGWSTTGGVGVGAWSVVLRARSVNSGGALIGTFSSTGTAGTVTVTTGTGTITLANTTNNRGGASAELNAALANLSFSLTNFGTPATVYFEAVVTDNSGTSAANATGAFKSVTINQAPEVDLNGATAGTGSSASFTEDQGAVAFATAATVTDPNSANLASMTVTLTNRPDGTVESLSYTTAGGITGSYDSSTGVLALSGSTTLANYQSVLRSISYNNTSQNPTTTNRLISVLANDGTSNSALATATVTVTAVNDAPTIVASGTLNYTENAAATVLNSGVTVNDVDNANLTSATVSITSGFTAGDLLEFGTLPTGISGSYASGVLSLTGSATLANYQSALQSITFRSTSENPTATSASRRVTWTVSDGSLSATGATTTILITAVNDAPVVDLNGAAAGTGSLVSFTEKTPVSIAQSGTITDADSTQLTQLVVNLTNAKAGDVLTMPVSTDVTSSYSNGVLTITPISGSTAALSVFEAALRSVQFNNTSSIPDLSPRRIEVQATDNGTPGAGSNIAVAQVLLTAVNDAPVYQNNLVNQTPVIGLPFSYTLAQPLFVDPEGDSLTIQANVASSSASNATLSSLPSWLTFNASTLKFYGVAPSGTAPFIVRLTATDPQGLKGYGDYTITPSATLSGNNIVSVGFPSAYNLVNGSQHSSSGHYTVETNSFTTASAPISGSNFVFYQATDGSLFSGNNVPGTLMYLTPNGDVGSISGIVSRPMKTSGNVTRGLYMWVDNGTANNVTDDSATLLVIDKNYFANSTIYNTSSDQVTSALNAYLTQSAFSIASASALESNGTISFVITRSGSGAADVRFTTSVESTDSASLNDYVSKSEVVSFGTNETSKTVTVSLVNDSLFEGNETFTVTLTDPVNARIETGVAKGTIIDDDPAPTVSIANSGNIEGLGIVFTITRTGNAQASQSVSYATSLATSGIIASTDDFVATSGQVTFAPGETTKKITVATVQDELLESNETFLVTLSAPTNGLVITGQPAVGTIQDDESTVFYYVDSAQAVEGVGMQFVIKRTGTVQNRDGSNVDQGQTIQYWAVARTGDTATPGSSSPGDFTSIPATNKLSVKFNESDLQKTVTVDTTADGLYEGNETFGFFIDGLSTLVFNPTRQTAVSPFGGEATGTIVDDDAQPSFNVAVLPADSSGVIEGGNVRFRITRTGDAQYPQTVDYSTVIRATDSASANDFTSQNGTLTFVSGQATQTVTVASVNDTVAEGPETFGLRISNPTGGAVLGVSEATGTLLDSNTAPTTGSINVGLTEPLALEDTTYVFSPSDFSYTDNETPDLVAIRISSIPDARSGVLERLVKPAQGAAYWEAVTVGTEISVSGTYGIAAGGLRFVPAANVNLENSATVGGDPTITYQVSDGSLWSSVASLGSTILKINPVNDEPSGADEQDNVFIGGEYIFNESDFGYSDPIDSNEFLSVIFTDVPQQSDARGTVQLLVSGPTTSLTGTLAGARDIISSSYTSALTGSPFTTGTAINPAQNDGYDLVLEGRYGRLFLNSTSGGYKFEQYTQVINGTSTAVYIEKYIVDGATKTPEYEPLVLNSGAMAVDGFVLKTTTSTAEDPTSQFRRTINFKLISHGDGTFDVVQSTWRTLSDGETVLISKVMDQEVRYAPCFTGVCQLNIDGTSQLTVPSGTDPYFQVKFKVQDNGGTANGGIDTDQTPNTVSFYLVDDLTPAINIPPEQVISEDGSLAFTGTTGSNALYITYNPTLADGQTTVDDVHVEVSLSQNSRPGHLSLEGSGYAASVTPITDSGRIVGYIIEGSVAEVNAVLADLLFTPDGDLFSTYDADPTSSNWSIRYPGVNGIDASHTYAKLNVEAENIPSAGSTKHPSVKREMDILVSNVNDAPVVVGTSPSLNVDEDNKTSSGTLISTLVNSNFSDATDAAPLGSEHTTSQTLAGLAIANYVPAVASKGQWQYSADGNSWTNLHAIASTASALALPSTYRLRFVPVTNYNGSIPSLTTYLIESSDTSVTAGNLNVSTRGGTTRFSQAPLTITGTVNAINDAPIATGTATLASVLEDTVSPPGATVSSLFSNNFSDVADAVTGGSSANTFAGIAIVGYDRVSTKGEWQYSSNGGTSWTNISTSISGNATAVTFAPTDMLRFVPRTDFNGPAPSLTTRLLESPRNVVSGATDDVSNNGSSSTVSSNTVVLSHTVTAVNDAPSATGSVVLLAINEDQTNPPGSTVSNLFSSTFSDLKDQVAGGSNANGLFGVAIQPITQDSTKGSWEYSSDNINWQTVPNIANASESILLKSADRLRFLPAENYFGPATSLSVRLIDNSNVANNLLATGSVIDTSSNGGTTPISTAVVPVLHAINPVNDPPVSNNDSLTIYKDETRQFTSNDFGPYSDVEDQPFTSVKIESLPTRGLLQYNNSGVWTTITTTGGSYLVTDGLANLRYIPDTQYATSNNGYSDTLKFKVSDGIDFSSNEYTLTIQVDNQESPVDPNSSTVDVTSFSPVNEGSLWAMFRVDGTGGDQLTLTVSDGGNSGPSTTGLENADIWFSYNGTNWDLYNSNTMKPTVPGTIGSIGTFYVRVSIVAEQETTLDTSEKFTLTATAVNSALNTDSSETTILDNGSGAIFSGSFANEIPGTSNTFRDDDRISAADDLVYSPIVNTIEFSDVRSNDTAGGLGLSELIGLNPTSSSVSSTVTTAEGTWNVLTGGKVRFTPASGRKTDPSPMPYAISPDGGLNYSLNTAYLYVDYGVVTQPDSTIEVPLNAAEVFIDVLANDTLGDAYDKDSLKLVGASNLPVDTLTVTGQGTWSVVTGSNPQGRKVLRFVPERDAFGNKSFSGDPTAVRYTVKDNVSSGGRGGNSSGQTLASIRYTTQNNPTFFVRINDLSNDATKLWDVVIVDNIAAGQSVSIYEGNNVYLTLVTTDADQSDTVGVIYYQGTTNSYSTVKVDARSKPVTTGSVADIKLSTTTQSIRAASIEIQASDQGFVSANSSTNRLASPLSGTNVGGRVEFRETLGRANQALPNVSDAIPSTPSGSNLAFNTNFVQNVRWTTASNIAVSTTSNAFATSGGLASLMKSLKTINSGAGQIASLAAGGKIINDEMSIKDRLAATQWVLAPGLFGVSVTPPANKDSSSWFTPMSFSEIQVDSSQNWLDFSNRGGTIGAIGMTAELSNSARPNPDTESAPQMVGEKSLKNSRDVVAKLRIVNELEIQASDGE